MQATAPDLAQPPLKVSVVVPVYNPGSSIDRCIASMLDQSLPPTEFEVIFVDDGSTDDSPARLDRLAQEHANFRVIHTPNSGWPGRPRNIGIGEARGHYVQFVDQDDWMAPEALERLYEMGVANGSDIVIGKVASNFRGVPQGVFRRNREKVTIHDGPLIDSLTPHKMFRTEFLRQHGILFPEGKRRLEDQLFMVRAYFPAKAVSILGDYVCYFYARREDGRNTGSQRFDPDGYYANLREVIDVVLENTTPGDFRTRLLRRFYRVEMLSRLAEPRYLKHDPEYRGQLFRAIRNLAVDVFGPEVEAELGAILRLRSDLLRRDRPDEMDELARRLAPIEARTELAAATWRRGKLEIAVRSRFSRQEGAGDLVLVSRDGRHLLDPGITDDLGSDPIDVTDELDSLRLQLSIRNVATGEEWLARMRTSLEWEEAPGGDSDRVVPVIHASATIDPQLMADQAPLARGSWRPMVRLTGFGLDRRGAVSAQHGEEEVPLWPALLGPGPRTVIPSFDADGRLTLDVETETHRLGDALAGRSVGFEPEQGHAVAARLPIAGTEETGRMAASIVVPGLDGERVVEAVIEPRGQQMWLVGGERGRMPRGLRHVTARFDGAELSLERDAPQAVAIGARSNGRTTPRRLAARAVEAARHSDWARSVYWRLPESGRALARSVYRMVRGSRRRS